MKNLATMIKTAAAQPHRRLPQNRVGLTVSQVLFALRKCILPCSKNAQRSGIKMIINRDNLPPVLQTNRTRTDIAPQLEGIMFSQQGKLRAAPSPPAMTAGSTTFFYPLEIIMSHPTQPAAVVQQPAPQQTAVAPGGNDIEHVEDDVAAARLTAIRIRGQHAGLDGDEPA